MFVARVRDEAGLPSQAAAERAVHATLETLAGGLEGMPAFIVASQIPGGIARRAAGSAAPDLPLIALPYPSFVRRVGEREGGVPPEEAEAHARAVLSVLDEAITGSNMSRLREQLPADYAPLFATNGPIWD